MKAPKLHRRTARPTVGRVKAFLAAVGVPLEAYRFGFNCRTLLDWWDYNPRWTLRDWEQMVLQERDHILAVAQARNGRSAWKSKEGSGLSGDLP